jgi:hypothetical protein
LAAVVEVVIAIRILVALVISHLLVLILPPLALALGGLEIILAVVVVPMAAVVEVVVIYRVLYLVGVLGSLL